MDSITIFSTGLAIALILSLIIAIYLNKWQTLTQILVDLCGTELRARFWVRITNVSMILTAILMALSYDPSDELLPLYQHSKHLSKTLLGLLLAVLALSITITRFVRRIERPAEYVPQ